MSEHLGQWVTPDVNYVDPDRRFCAFCGRPIARRFWLVEQKGQNAAVYCSPEHAMEVTAYPEMVRRIGLTSDGTACPGT